MATQDELAHINAQLAAGHDQAPGEPNHDAAADPVASEMRELANKLGPILDYVKREVDPLLARYYALAESKGPLFEKHNTQAIIERMKHDLQFIADVASTGK